MDGFTSAIAKKCDRVDPTDPMKSQGPLYVQLVLSLALGVSAFFGFCVSLPASLQHVVYRSLLIKLVSSPEMEELVRRSEAAHKCCRRFARPPGHIFWVDASALQDHRAASSCFRRS